jgi:hypothetical protein
LAEFITLFFVASGLGSLILKVDIFREVVSNLLEHICREDYILLTHPRASYIHKVRKQDVDAELALGLSFLGSRDMLRKRLGMYAQTNPKGFVHIEWVNEVSSWVLKEELKEVKVSVEGEWNDTANRLVQQF